MPCCDRNSHPSSGQIWAAEFDRSHFPQPKDGLHAQPTNLTRIAIAALALGASLVAGADPFDTPRINVFVSLPVDGGHRQAPTLGLNLQRNGLASSPLDLSANRFTFFDLRYQARNDSLKLNGLELGVDRVRIVVDPALADRSRPAVVGHDQALFPGADHRAVAADPLHVSVNEKAGSFAADRMESEIGSWR